MADERSPHRLFRRFHFIRSEDVSGVSGTGIVAEGVQFSTGWVAVTFTTKGVKSVIVFASMPDFLEVHGHEGKSVPAFLDGEEA